MSLNVEMSRMISHMKAMEQSASMDRVKPTNLAEGLNQSANLKPDAPSFGSMLESAVDQVNQLSQESGALKKAFLSGDPNVDITRVMVASEKSSIATSAMIEVRNKLINSYKEIMNMPV